MHSTWSTARLIFSMRSPRQAQIDGPMKWMVRMPCCFRRSSRSRLKSGASTPMNASGGILQQPLRQAVADAQQLGIVAQHLGIATDRQLVARPPGLESVRAHPRTADAHRGERRPALPEAAQQQPGQQVAGGLAGHHRQTRGAVFHRDEGRKQSPTGRKGQRAMPRRDWSRNAVIKSRSPAPSGDSGTKASMAARACSRVRLDR